MLVAICLVGAHARSSLAGQWIGVLGEGDLRHESAILLHVILDGHQAAVGQPHRVLAGHLALGVAHFVLVEEQILLGVLDLVLVLVLERKTNSLVQLCQELNAQHVVRTGSGFSAAAPCGAADAISTAVAATTATASQTVEVRAIVLWKTGSVCVCVSQI